jgi:hypothetical protein
MIGISRMPKAKSVYQLRYPSVLQLSGTEPHRSSIPNILLDAVTYLSTTAPLRAKSETASWYGLCGCSASPKKSTTCGGRSGAFLRANTR